MSQSRSISRSRSRLRRERERDQHHHRRRNHHEERSREREQTSSAETSSSNLIDAETIAWLHEEHSKPVEFAKSLMLKLFTMDELTVENVNVEGRKGVRSKEPAVGLSPRRVAELRRHCLDNVAINMRESIWKECRKACNNRMWHLKVKKDKENKKQQF